MLHIAGLTLAIRQFAIGELAKAGGAWRKKIKTFRQFGEFT